jgi:S-adenosylmethionine decarboxylase
VRPRRGAVKRGLTRALQSVLLASALPIPETGIEWLVDAHGCDPAALRSLDTLSGLFGRIVSDLRLHPLTDPQWHVFPGPGGVTGLLLLSESHLACHTFPERGFASFNLYCCRPRPEWPWAARLREVIQAERVDLQMIPRGGP